MPPIILIAGAPATGKSTVSRALAATFPRSIAICVDDLRSMVISGVVHPSSEWNSALIEQLRLARTSAAVMAQNYHTAGFAVLIDDFWDPNSQLSEYGDLLGHPDLRRVILYPAQHKAHTQNRQRSGSEWLRDYLDDGIRTVYGELNQTATALVQAGWIMLDTTNDTVETSVARLQALCS